MHQHQHLPRRRGHPPGSKNQKKAVRTTARCRGRGRDRGHGRLRETGQSDSETQASSGSFEYALDKQLKQMQISESEAEAYVYDHHISIILQPHHCGLVSCCKTEFADVHGSFLGVN